jgi:peptidoglycan/LPS O-acetylase OafA/YrhL
MSDPVRRFPALAFSLRLSLQGRARDPRRLRDFFVRRFFRIAPLWWFAIALSTAAAATTAAASLTHVLVEAPGQRQGRRLLGSA